MMAEYRRDFQIEGNDEHLVAWFNVAWEGADHQQIRWDIEALFFALVVRTTGCLGSEDAMVLHVPDLNQLELRSAYNVSVKEFLARWFPEMKLVEKRGSVLELIAHLPTKWEIARVVTLSSEEARHHGEHQA
jgi:hypothetical protein